MANYYYIKSGFGTRVLDTTFTAAETGAFGAGNLTAANCYANLGAIGTLTAPGSFIFVSHLHNAYYDNGSSVTVGGIPDTYTGIGVQVISVEDSDVTLYRPGGKDALSDNFDKYAFEGNGLVHGVDLYTDNDPIVASSTGVWVFKDMTVQTGSGNDKYLSTGVDGFKAIFFNVHFEALNDHITNGFTIWSGASLEINGGSLLGPYGPDSFIFSVASGAGGADVLCRGVDLSVATGAIMNTATAGTSDIVDVQLYNCKLSPTITVPSPGVELATAQQTFKMLGCDNGTNDALHRFYIADGCGSAENNDSVYVSANPPWYEGTARSSMMVKTSAICSHAHPFVFEIPARYVNLADNNVLTINLTSSLTLTDTEICATLCYPDGTINVEPNWVTSGNTYDATTITMNPLAAGTTLTNVSGLGSGDWSGGLANFYSFELDTSGNPGGAAIVKVMIEVTRASILTGTLYIDPIIGI